MECNAPGIDGTAFLLDKDLATIEVQPYFEELTENKEKEQFEELPLCVIKEKYKNLEGGDKFIQELQKSQAGKKHPQFDDENWRIYKIFKSIATTSAVGQTITCTMRVLALYLVRCMSIIYVCQGANINRVGNKTKARMEASGNRAERNAIAETLEAKVASMGKPATASGKGNNKGEKKRKKDGEIIAGVRLVVFSL
ncbi:NaCP60E [Symbiodinium sp. CCMP2456]|nr:NaCP60E [Symbiodinium sp. CCMP2456]